MISVIAEFREWQALQLLRFAFVDEYPALLGEIAHPVDMKGRVERPSGASLFRTAVSKAAGHPVRKLRQAPEICTVIHRSKKTSARA